ncbi:enoyl-CoA hydratase [uncultured Gordonia sp.]|uniref:enoyl-CoA hydratase n=1 Tax=Gordonia sp. (in: high G+C Gram-positive bacteria) TaxID=84139 RepID=UPI000FBD2ABA|nr:enoyl-CoA hydratase [uncultured Gordonia sp.]RUP36321.1 MAG: enoyl-CoA hydratase [Gordonia sp. (in: high G+C Gram-positive bacteria)]HNP57796.1 enoyl-CoA hydratase [Gordonia sp. (in: high G+C Gram-positive bacteria)]
MADDLILTRRYGATLVVTLNRPKSRNALNSGLIVGLQRAIAAAGSDDEVAVVVLTGADPAFCAGVDLKQFGSEDAWTGDTALPETPTGHPWTPIDKPVIGAVNGAAITGGLELALACDILIASDRAVFADTHARVGIMPMWGLTARLPEMVGFAFAKRMSLSGNFVDAKLALQHGLVTEVVEHDQLLPTCLKLADDIASNHRAAVASLLGSYNRVRDDHLVPQAQIEADTAKAWLSGGGAKLVDTSTESVFERGRSQLS